MFIIQIILSLPEPSRYLALWSASYPQLILWHFRGKPLPPPKVVKVLTILKFSKKYKIRTLVETGTYLGETVELINKHFDRIYSIELDKDLYLKARKTFLGKRKIKIIPGDSKIRLPALIKNIKKPCLFWLDAHYSKGITAKGKLETPVLKELEAIAKSKIKKHLILIDDAREFTGKGNYPTLKKIKKLTDKKFPDYQVKVKDDIIHLNPK